MVSEQGCLAPATPPKPPTLTPLVLTSVPHNRLCAPGLPAAPWKGVRAPQRADTHHRGLRAATPGEMWPGGLRALGGPGSEKGLRVTQQVTHHLVTVPSPSGLLLWKRLPPPWIPPTAVVTAAPVGPTRPSPACLGFPALLPCPAAPQLGAGGAWSLSAPPRDVQCRDPTGSSRAARGLQGADLWGEGSEFTWPLLLPIPSQACGTLGVPAPLPAPVERRPLAGGGPVALGVPSSLCPPGTLTGLRLGPSELAQGRGAQRRPIT